MFFNWFLDHLAPKFGVAETLGCKSVVDVWSTLEKTHFLRSKTHEIQLNDELQHLCEGNDFVTVYSIKFFSYCDQLAAIGSSIPETNNLHRYCCGLGLLFSTFSLSQMHIITASILWDAVFEVESYSPFQKYLEGSPLALVAFVANNGSNSHNNQCGGRSHGHSSFSGGSRFSHAYGSYNNSNSEHQNNRHPYAPSFQICKVDGHYVINCHDRYARS